MTRERRYTFNILTLGRPVKSLLQGRLLLADQGSEGSELGRVEVELLAVQVVLGRELICDVEEGSDVQTGFGAGVGYLVEELLIFQDGRLDSDGLLGVEELLEPLGPYQLLDLGLDLGFLGNGEGV